MTKAKKIIYPWIQIAFLCWECGRYQIDYDKKKNEDDNFIRRIKCSCGAVNNVKYIVETKETIHIYNPERYD
jgi:hypothetical protein